jgi:hypothetical protein
MVKALALAGLLALSGCQTAKGSFCAIAKPIRPSVNTIATMTDAEVQAVLAHNTKGQRICHWKP